MEAVSWVVCVLAVAATVGAYVEVWLAGGGYLIRRALIILNESPLAIWTRTQVFREGFRLFSLWLINWSCFIKQMRAILERPIIFVCLETLFLRRWRQGSGLFRIRFNLIFSLNCFMSLVWRAISPFFCQFKQYWLGAFIHSWLIELLLIIYFLFF